MADLATTTARERFGSWWKTVRTLDTTPEERDAAWAAWQAAERAMAERAAKDEIDWHVISEAVADAVSNADGQISAHYLEHAFQKAGIGVYHAPAKPKEGC